MTTVEDRTEEFHVSPPPVIPALVASSGDSAPAEPVAKPSADLDRPRAIAAKTLDERLSLWGSLVGSLSLVWLLYFQLLPFSGDLGFVVAWFVVFLALYAGVTAQSNPRTVVVDRLASAAVTAMALVIFGTLARVIYFVVDKGYPAFDHLNFYTHTMGGVRPTAGLDQGGAAAAIVGSGIQVGIAALISLPIGIGTAVFMTEFGGRYSRLVRIVVESMTALPDILAGLFVYVVLLLGLGQGHSGIAVSIALAITITPIIARAADVTLRLIPGGLKEASLALGASQWSTLWKVVLPTVRTGLGTALILGVARSVGETAPLLIVDGVNTFYKFNPLSGPMNSLPLYIYNGFTSGEPNNITRAYGAASVLLALVVILFTLTRFLARDRKKSSR